MLFTKVNVGEVSPWFNSDCGLFTQVIVLADGVAVRRFTGIYAKMDAIRWIRGCKDEETN